MKRRWAQEFVTLVSTNGLPARVTRRVNGWPETGEIAGYLCFMKSMTFQEARSEYFTGVDPSKVHDRRDFAVLYGGLGSRLRDIFIFPAAFFFSKVQSGKPINTYKAPKEYFQYKIHLRQREQEWQLDVQGAEDPPIIDEWRFSVPAAVSFFKTHGQK